MAAPNWDYKEYVSSGTIEQYLEDVANDAIAKANDAADALSALVIPESGTPDSFVPFDFNNLSLVMPAAPTVPTLNEPDLSGDKPVKPTLTMSLVATDAIISDLIATIKSELLARLSGNSVIENALFQRFKDKAIAEFTAAFASVKSALSSSGWSRPTGKGQNSVEELYLKATIAETGNFAREVSIIQHQEQQKILDQLLNLESNLINAKAGDESNKIRLYDSEWQGYINNIRIYNDLNQMITAMYAAQVQGYAATGRLKTEEMQVLMAKINAINTAHEQLASISIKKIEMINAYNIAKFGANSEAYRAAGGIYGQLASTALNGMNISTSFSYSQSKSEGHSFDG